LCMPLRIKVRNEARRCLSCSIKSPLKRPLS
jgi:hypothetical protein